MQLTLGFSPCPNDTFIFDALVNNKIDTESISFSTVIEDVQQLNERVNKKQLDITKLSFPAFFNVNDEYNILSSGNALGYGVGPLLVSNNTFPLDEISTKTIALPGKDTTAHLLFSYAFPKAKNKKFILFSEIEKEILADKVDAGVIIHENRFTYEKLGLKKIIDLGDYWEQKTKFPVPLGCIAINQKFDEPFQNKISSLIKKSIEYAYQQLPTISDFVRQHAQAMDEDVMRQHINLYVNKQSMELDQDGLNAITHLKKVYCEVNGLK